MKNKIVIAVIGVLLTIILAFGGLMLYLVTHPATDCDSCLSGKTL